MYLSKEDGSEDPAEGPWVTRARRWLALLRLHPTVFERCEPGLWEGPYQLGP